MGVFDVAIVLVGLLVVPAGDVSGVRNGAASDTGGFLAQSKNSSREAAKAEKARGDGLVAQGKLAQAEAAYRKAISLDPGWYQPYEALGKLFFRQKKYALAVEQFKKAIEVEPRYYTGLYNIAFALRKAGKYDQAIEYYRKYLQKIPTDPDGYYGLAAACEAKGDWKNAIKNYELYAQKETRPSERQYVIKAREKAEFLRRKYAQQAPRKEGEVKKTVQAAAPAAAAKTTGGVASTTGAGQKTASKPAAPARPPLAPAAVSKQQGKQPAASAKEAAREKERQAREEVAGLIRRGDEALRKKQYSVAMKYYFDATKKDPHNTEALYKLGLVYKATGSDKAAELKWKKVLSIDPNHKGAKEALSRLGSGSVQAHEKATVAAAGASKPAERAPAPAATQMAGRPKLPAAAAASGAKGENVAARQKAVSPEITGNQRVRDYIRKGDEWFRKKAYSRAIDAYTKAANMAPRNEEALFKLGLAYALAGNYSVAIYKWQKVLEINPNNKTARNNIEKARRKMASSQQSKQAAATPPSKQEVKALVEAGNGTAALEMANRLLAKNGKDVELLLLKGRALILLKKYGEAKRVLTKAMVTDPNRAEPFYWLGEANRLGGDAERARYYFRLYLRSRSPDVETDKVKQAQAFVGG